MAGQARFALQRPGPLPYTECFPQSSLITHAKEKLVDQDALVSSLLAFDFESEGQSSGFGASDDLSDIWGAVGADKGQHASSSSGDSRSTATNLSVESPGMSLLTMGSGTVPIPCPGLKRPTCTASSERESVRSLKKAKSGCSKVEERQLSEASWSCLPASQAAASLTQSDSTQISSQAAGRCCTAAASMASPKALVAASMPLPVQASGAPLAAAPGFQVAAQLTFQYGPIAPGPFTAGCLPPAAIMHPGATSVMTSAPPPFGVALGQPQMAVFPTWHFAGSSPAAAPTMLAPALLGQPSGVPAPMYCTRMITSPHAPAPWFVTPPMIPNPELGQPSNEGGGPPLAQRAIAEFLAQPNQAPPLGLKLDTAALAAQIGASSQPSAF